MKNAAPDGYTLMFTNPTTMAQDKVLFRMATGSYASQLPFLQQGSLKVIAAPTPKRMKNLSDVPTFHEQGFTDRAFQLRGWVGCAAPAGTPEEILAKLSDLTVEVARTERVQKINDQFGIDEGAQGRACFRKVLDEEGPVMLEVIKDLDIEPA